MTKENTIATKTYYIFYSCGNCNFSCVIHYKCGEMAETSLMCPNCETEWLRKAKSGSFADPFYAYHNNKLTAYGPSSEI